MGQLTRRFLSGRLLEFTARILQGTLKFLRNEATRKSQVMTRFITSISSYDLVSGGQDEGMITIVKISYYS